MRPRSRNSTAGSSSARRKAVSPRSSREMKSGPPRWNKSGVWPMARCLAPGASAQYCTRQTGASTASGPAPSHPASSEKFHPRTWSRKAAWRAASRSGAPTGRNGPILSPTSRAGQAGAPVGSAPRKQAASSGNPLASRSEEHTSELQSLTRISYAVFCLKKKQQYVPPYENIKNTLASIAPFHHTTITQHPHELSLTPITLLDETHTTSGQPRREHMSHTYITTQHTNSNSVDTDHN